MTGEGAAGTSATVRDEAGLGAVTEVGLVAGRTGDGTEIGLAPATDALVGHAVGSGAGTELEADDEAEAAAGFGEFGWSKTEAETGTMVGSWAGVS